MLVRDRAGLEMMRCAQEEVRSLRGNPVPDDFHGGKLAAVWARARKSPAFRGLPEFSWENFESLPVMTKEGLKSDPWHYAVTDVSGAAKYYETTGTTGRVTPTPRLAEDVIWNTVSVAEAWRSILRDGDRVAVLLPSDVVPVADLIVSVCEYLGLPHSRLYPFATGISDWDRLLGFWENLRPTTLFASPGVVLQLTRLLKQRQLMAQHSSAVRDIMLLGEVSTPPLRARLGQWWDATAHDASYGSTETGTLAAACPRGRLHLLTGTNYFELATDQGLVPLPAHGKGRLVVTPLNLYARPMLRLDTGDDVEIDTGGCDCPDRAPVVVVCGRSSETIEIHGARLTILGVENAVYGATEATGYLVEVDSTGQFGRLLLERGIGADRAAEPAAIEELQRLSENELGLHWDAVVFVNSLPSTTKSGGSQKSWKRSNIRVVEPA
ncbi:phenylacetate--CoA ligase family protein [Streptomyces ovatisporus]|uniref:Phenylacetate--CoA ligase family protein n=1 Tax=Streptomyces ovatisporus TaxID=1128682 RepID=A0ABV9A771_9ACTN